MYVNGGGTCADAGAKLMYTQPKGKRCGGANANGEDKMSLSFLFYIFGETVYTDEGSRPVARSIAEVAVSRLTDVE